jgi:site-specific DNA recombinase
MRVGIYARVASKRQAQDHTIDQQVASSRRYIQEQGWPLSEESMYRDDGYSGAHLSRPGLDRLRDAAALAEIEVVVITAPDRLARKYLHQVLLIEELESHGVSVVFVERPMSADPHDQLLLQIRGAVAEYERTLITERMRRGKLAKLRAGLLLAWTRGHFGYRVDPERPRDPAGVCLDSAEGVVIQQLFTWYLEEGATLYTVGKHLEQAEVVTPRGCAYWTGCTVRAILHDPTYTGVAYGNRYRSVPAAGRRSPLLPVGAGKSYVLKPPAEWVAIPVPAIVSAEEFARVQQKRAHNQQTALRNTQHPYLLRGHVSCGRCHLTATARTTPQGHQYYVCRGRTDRRRVSQGERCTSRYIPARQLDEVVWADLCAVLTDPQQLLTALERAQSGAWLPQEVQARQANVQQALAGLERQQERLLTAYLGEILELPAFERKRHELEQKVTSLRAQQQQVEARVQQRRGLEQIAASIEQFCSQVRAGLQAATFEQRRLLVELLLDQVVVTDEEVEIRSVMPTSPNGVRQPFCQLRLDYRGGLPARVCEHSRSSWRVGALLPFLQWGAPAPGLRLSPAGDGLCPARHTDHGCESMSERTAPRRSRRTGQESGPRAI